MIHEFTLEKCKTKAAYSAKLKKQRQLDLRAIARKMEIVMETPILLVVKEYGIQAIVHRYGEILFKNCEDEKIMRKIAEKIYAV
ncbi:hypothetical protein HY495_02660 [Candidatus Woesearchaeota archaeon]|nr:hypothetical protein [Candidatus Woesearchaeota archaeon]